MTDPQPRRAVAALSLLLLFGALAFEGLRPLADLDLWWNIRVGAGRVRAGQASVSGHSGGGSVRGRGWTAYHWLWAHALEQSIVQADRQGHGAEALMELQRMRIEDPDNLWAEVAHRRIEAMRAQ